MIKLSMKDWCQLKDALTNGEAFFEVLPDDYAGSVYLNPLPNETMEACKEGFVQNFYDKDSKIYFQPEEVWHIKSGMPFGDIIEDQK